MLVHVGRVLCTLGYQAASMVKSIIVVSNIQAGIVPTSRNKGLRVMGKVYVVVVRK